MCSWSIVCQFVCDKSDNEEIPSANQSITRKWARAGTLYWSNQLLNKIILFWIDCRYPRDIYLEQAIHGQQAWASTPSWLSGHWLLPNCPLMCHDEEIYIELLKNSSISLYQFLVFLHQVPHRDFFLGHVGLNIASSLESHLSKTASSGQKIFSFLIELKPEQLCNKYSMISPAQPLSACTISHSHHIKTISN